MDAVTSANRSPVVAEEAPPDSHAQGPFAAMRRVLPAGEVIRFLLVGVFNTVSSLAIYSSFVVVFGRLLPRLGEQLIVDLASIVSKPIGITIAFLCYKHFVFRTHGNYLKEWLRCFAVYGVSTPAELVILPVATGLFLHMAVLRVYAPFLAGVVNAVIIATYSYFAHKKFSFKR
jgi:putative flippase GtrA